MKNTIRHRTAKFSVMAGSVAAVAGAALVLPLSGMSGAATPQIAQIFQPSGSSTQVAAGATITDQTTVEVKVPANSTLANGQSVQIFECADPDGQTDDLPIDGSSCDGLTVNGGATLNEGPTGTVDKRGYEIFALPSAALSEPSNANPVCNATSACVLYVGENLNDFSKPFVWSTPFYVGATVGTPTPESPLTIGIPAAALLVLGGGTALTIRRRRRSAAA